MDLTSDLIALNPSHYTIWNYRYLTFKHLLGHSPSAEDREKHIRNELEWVNGIIEANKKNYQVWRYRQHLITLLYPSLASPDNLPPKHTLNHQEEGKKELEWIKSILDLDFKNYHAWSYRQWVVEVFGMWEDEWQKTEEWITNVDLRNNSIWNQRFWVFLTRIGRAPQSGVSSITTSNTVDKEWVSKEVEKEVEWTWGKIKKAPNNECSWTYLGGLLRLDGTEAALSKLRQRVDVFCDELAQQSVQSPHLLSYLLEKYLREQDEEKARHVVTSLCRVDPIRTRYWHYRLEQAGFNK